jgi:hypothetical protein
MKFKGEPDGAGKNSVLYALRDDPFEQSPLEPADYDTATMMQYTRRVWQRSAQLYAELSVETGAPTKPSAEALKTLEGLGYISDDE